MTDAKELKPLSKKPRVEVLHIEQGATPDLNNVNKHTQRGGKLLSNSLRKRGAFRSIASAGKGVEIPVVGAGNYTLENAVDAGFTEVVNVHVTGNQLVNVVRDDIAPGSPEFYALAIEDNEIGKQSYSPDIDVLASLAASDGAILKALREEDKIFDGMLEGMGLKSETVDAEPQIDRAAELLEKWQVKTGDLWQIGEHRLLCGDCTKREDVDKVMGGEKAQLVFTDPPYGVDYDGGAATPRERLSNDERDTDIYAQFLKATTPITRDDAALYIWFAGIRCFETAGALRSAGWVIRSMIIWNKLNAHFGALGAQYKHKYEPLFYCHKRGKSPKWHGPTNEVSVWDQQQPSINEFHPTQKPVEHAERAINNSSLPDEIVADWFSGSGTTLVACENLRRKCRAIEISPAYCAVTLERMSQAFPHLEIKRVEGV